jgi:hypothetical protein
MSLANAAYRVVSECCSELESKGTEFYGGACDVMLITKKRSTLPLALFHRRQSPHPAQASQDRTTKTFQRRKATDLMPSGIGSNEQIFGANEQVPGRAVRPTKRVSARRCGIVFLVLPQQPMEALAESGG